MAFETNIGQTAIVVDRQLDKRNIRAETWLYDLGKDCWTRIKTATFPFGCGMNYNMVYDPNHKVLLLVTGGKEGKRTAVWALKVDLS
jgi:hypothetical protein